MDEIIQQVVEQLKSELPDLMNSGQSWQAELHGKGKSIRFKISRIVHFPKQPQSQR
jgi:hypothetical protein